MKLGSGAFGLTEHQLMLADLFRPARTVIPEGEPKNIEVLTALARPLPRHKSNKFAEDEDAEREALKKMPKAHDLGEPKNLEILVGLARPTPRLHVKKFDEEMAILKVKPKSARSLPEPKNLEKLMDLSKPTKKYVQ
jgi:hypothetical protein